MGAQPDAIDILAPQPKDIVSDLAIGYDGILYLAIGGQLLLNDRRNRWDNTSLVTENFNPWRITPDPKGGLWVLDRNRNRPQLGRVSGIPLATTAVIIIDGSQLNSQETFSACALNPNPPRLRPITTATLPPDETPVAIACSPNGRLAVLLWKGDKALLRLLTTAETWSDPILLQQSAYPYSLAWTAPDRIAILQPSLSHEALVYVLPDHPISTIEYDLRVISLETETNLIERGKRLVTIARDAQEELHFRIFDEKGYKAIDLKESTLRENTIDQLENLKTLLYPYWNSNTLPIIPEIKERIIAAVTSITNYISTLDPVGDFYALRQFAGDPFCHTLTNPAYYLATTPTPLIPIMLPAYATQGMVQLAQPIDSQNATMIWHRLYVEAVVPDGCGIQVWLAATNELRTPPTDWYEHRIGNWDNPDSVPLAAWLPSASEIPFHAGLLDCSRQPNRAGLFTVLIQRSARAVTSIQGRYLWVRLSLLGNGHTTPEFAALRVYGSRFSYINQYLPELYHENTFGSEADQIGASTPSDFLERFLSNFEGILTPLEDQIAYSDLLTDPRTTPTEALEWLGSWIGVVFDSSYPAQRRRNLLQQAPQLFRQRGTLPGLKLALDLATGGGVSGGEIIVIEDFRLRRTFATILGADLADESDPLLAGFAISGNSYVGDTLILGDETKREFLALFSANLSVTGSEGSSINSFFEDLAHRVTLFIHNDVEPQDLGLIRRIVEQEAPAHVITTLAFASYPLMVGLASLVGVDTYLRPKRPPNAVQSDRSRIGMNDLIQRPASLDPRVEGERSPPPLQRPVATITPLPIVEAGQSFTLNAQDSSATGDRQIVRYIWTRLT
jgi:phage tail-like protein